MSQRKIVFFSPLPPQRNGIADYSASFLAELAETFHLVLVIADTAPAPTPIPRTRWIRVSDYLDYESEFAGLQHLYQVGNNVDHGHMLPLMQRRPGFTTLHDLSVHHMMDTVVGDALLPAYREIVTECYGVNGLAVTRDIAFRRARPEIFHLEIDFISLIARRSRAITTHSLTGKLRIGSAAPDTPVYRVPHPYQARARAYQGARAAARAGARAELNLPQDAVVLLSLGFVTRAKRIDLSLDALAWMTANGRRVIYVVAGAVDVGGFDLMEEIQRRDLQDSMIVTEYVPDALLLAYLAACDVLLNLRYPTMGETSGTITNALAIGCCAIVTAIGTFNEIPDHCAVKLPVEEMTPDGLLRRLLPLVDSPALRKYYEDNALRFALAEWSPDHFIKLYIDAIDDAHAHARAPQPICAPHRRFKAASSRREIEAVVETPATAQMWWRSLMLPIGESGQRLLVVGDPAAAALAERAFGWAGQVETDAEAARRGGAVAVALQIEDAEAFYRSPFERLSAANRALEVGGLLVFNVTGATPEMVDAQLGAPPSARRQSARPERKPSPLEALLACAGFRVERVVDRFPEVFYPPAGVGGEPAPADARVEFCIHAVKVTDKLRFSSPLLFTRH